MSKIRIIPLGGVREEGKNLYVVEVNQSIFILDCGLVFPDTDMLGIDAVIPDFSYLEDNRDRVVGVFLTDGHADAVGALPYLLEVVEAPVFGTELTIELAKIEAKSQGLEKQLDNFFVIDAETEIEFADASVSFFKTTHTIPDSIGIVVKTDQGSIIYTGDFKFDPSVSENYETDFNRLSEIGQEGVLALLSDSVGAANSAPNMSEAHIKNELVKAFRKAPGRVIVASIGSNIARIQQILDAAAILGRKIFSSDDQLYRIIDVSMKLGKLTVPSKDVIGYMKHLKKTPDDQVLILATGDVGVPIRELQEMAQGRHRYTRIQEGDLVYMATSPSLMMETMMAATKDMIYRAGGDVVTITDEFKVSGHATPTDLQMMISILKPKYLIPVNGDMMSLDGQRRLAREMGYAESQIFLTSPGDVIEYHDRKMRLVGEVTAGDTLVDGLGVGDIGNVVLRDRRILSEDGIFVVVATISRRLKRVLVGPQITSRGFVYMKTSIDLIATCSDMTLDVLEEHLDKKDFDWSDLKGDLRERIGKYLFKETKRRPLILPIIMEASSYQPPKGS